MAASAFSRVLWNYQLARSEADRSSDIDCFVLVRGEQATAQLIAHEVARDLEEERFDGDRYQLLVLVESTWSVRFPSDGQTRI